jgi:cytoskeletal protein RodZ
MEIFLLGVIVGGVVVWGYNKYLNTPITLDEALTIAKTEVKTTLDVNNDGKVNVEDAKAVVRRPRKKAGTTPQ